MGTSPKTGEADAEPGKTPEKQEALPMPHERDQALGDVEAKPEQVIKQAHQDLQDGQVDTDMRGTPGLDAERRKGLVNGKR